MPTLVVEIDDELWSTVSSLALRCYPGQRSRAIGRLVRVVLMEYLEFFHGTATDVG
jgi:hypothetical protein